MDNSSIDSITTTKLPETDAIREEIENLISIVKFILCVTCIFAVIVNLKVFACIHWIRRPMNSVLKISLSLALADICASCLSAVVIFYESYFSTRTFIILEIVRLCFILVTVFHLLGLGFNHYIGIRKPLHHNSRLTQKGISGLLVLLWFIPVLFTIALYTFEGGASFWQAMIEDNLIEENLILNVTFENISLIRLNHSHEFNQTEFFQIHNEMGENHIKFIETFRFRMAIGSFVLISMLLIGICYLWILIMIKRQRKIWKELSRTGSTVWRGNNCRHVTKEKAHEKNKIKGNFRAVYTTLIILGSCFMGWMPALLLYTLTCRRGCFISGDLLMKFNENYPRHIVMVRFFDNEMLFLKMIANPIIYSIRMKEIKEGTRQMHNVLLYHLCGKTCRSRHERYSKSISKTNHTNHSHVGLASLRSMKNDKHDSGRCTKHRENMPTSYL